MPCKRDSMGSRRLPFVLRGKAATLCMMTAEQRGDKKHWHATFSRSTPSRHEPLSLETDRLVREEARCHARAAVHDEQ